MIVQSSGYISWNESLAELTFFWLEIKSRQNEAFVNLLHSKLVKVQTSLGASGIWCSLGWRALGADWMCCRSIEAWRILESSSTELILCRLEECVLFKLEAVNWRRCILNSQMWNDYIFVKPHLFFPKLFHSFILWMFVLNKRMFRRTYRRLVGRFDMRSLDDQEVGELNDQADGPPNVGATQLVLELVE